MAAYRTYLLDGEEHISRVIEHEAPDDASALREAVAQRAQHAAVELWESARLVMRVGAEFSVQL